MRCTRCRESRTSVASRGAGAISFETVPALIFPGQRISSGTRKAPSSSSSSRSETASCRHPAASSSRRSRSSGRGRRRRASRSTRWSRSSRPRDGRAVIAPEPLASWNDGQARAAVLDFVERVSADGDPIGGAGRGLRQRRHPLVREAAADPGRLHPPPALRDGGGGSRPSREATLESGYERDYAWLGQVMVEHYAGDDTNVRSLLGRCDRRPCGHQRRRLRKAADEFLRSAQHPTLGRGYLACGYAPMVELLRYLEENGFSNYIASGGGRDFMRPISEEMYGILRDRVIGSSTALDYVGRRRRRHDRAQTGGRRPRRRPGEADSDLEPNGASAAPRRGKLERRHPDARFHAAH